MEEAASGEATKSARPGMETGGKVRQGKVQEKFPTRDKQRTVSAVGSVVEPKVTRKAGTSGIDVYVGLKGLRESWVISRAHSHEKKEYSQHDEKNGKSELFELRKNKNEAQCHSEQKQHQMFAPLFIQQVSTASSREKQKIDLVIMLGQGPKSEGFVHTKKNVSFSYFSREYTSRKKRSPP